MFYLLGYSFFFFIDTATSEISSLYLHSALPIHLVANSGLFGFPVFCFLLFFLCIFPFFLVVPFLFLSTCSPMSVFVASCFVSSSRDSRADCLFVSWRLLSSISLLSHYLAPLLCLLYFFSSLSISHLFVLSALYPLPLPLFFPSLCLFALFLLILLYYFRSFLRRLLTYTFLPQTPLLRSHRRGARPTPLFRLTPPPCSLP